jgi:hypothetical protein
MLPAVLQSFQTWRSLAPAERRLTTTAFGLLLFVRCLLWVFQVNTLVRWAARWLPNAAPAHVTDVDSRRLVILVATVGRKMVPSASCLQRALVAWWLLNRRGVACGLTIGVRRAQGQMAAHAWLEIDGQVVGDRATVRTDYAPVAYLAPHAHPHV